MPSGLNVFYTELLQYLRRDVEKRMVEEGFDPSHDRSFRQFQDELVKMVELGAVSSGQSLQQIFEQYNFLIGTRGAVHVEAKLLDALPSKDFAALGLVAYFPKIYRGVPRLYARTNPSLSKIKSAFSHLPSLKRVAVEKALYSLYDSVLPEEGRLVVFTWVILDGLGDWTASREIVKLLRAALPSLEIEQIVMMPKRFEGQVESDERIVFYEGEAKLSLLKEKHWQAFWNADVILQTPTFYPHTQEWIDRIRRINPRVQFEHVGEYGFAESSWFHPKSGHYSMGLHFLEKGILTRKIKSQGFSSIKHPLLLSWLFGMQDPGPSEIEQYRSSHHFYLAYLKTEMGGKIYLHALLKSLERDERPIDICMPDLGWFVRHCQACKEGNKLCIEASLGVKQIEVWHPDGVYVEPVAESGKIVRLLYPGSMSSEDFMASLIASEEFVAVRGDQSFSEVVSANKIFFYDSVSHARYFMKDLAALAESRISTHRGALICIRLMVQGSLAQLPVEEGEWIDEVYFQKEEPFDWLETALQIGLALQDPDTLAGFKKFNRIISEELSCNTFFVHLIKRALSHVKDPALALLEERQLALFTTQRQSFKQLIENVRELLKGKEEMR